MSGNKRFKTWMSVILCMTLCLSMVTSYTLTGPLIASADEQTNGTEKVAVEDKSETGSSENDSENVSPGEEDQTASPEEILANKESQLQEAKKQGNADKIKKLEKELGEGYLSLITEIYEKYYSGKNGERVESQLRNNEEIASYHELKKEITNILNDETAKWEKLKDVYLKSNEFNYPRELTDSEKQLLDKLNDARSTLPPYMHGSNQYETLIEEYKNLSDEIENITDPFTQEPAKEEIEKKTAKLEELVALLNKALEEGNIKRAYTAGNGVEIKAFLLNSYMFPTKLLDEEVYYLPQNVPVNILLQFAKDEKNNDFEVEIKAQGEHLLGISPAKLKLYSGGNNYDFNLEDGIYKAKVKNSQAGISQTIFTIKGLTGELHQGFTMTIRAGSGDKMSELSREFLITKSGYKDDFKVGGIGDFNDDTKSYPVVDAGSADEKGLVNIDTDKIVDILPYFEKNSYWIDEVLKNGTPDSVELEHARIEIKLPSFDGKLAKYVERNGIKYEYDADKGILVLDVSRKLIKSNIKVDENGIASIGGIPISNAKLKDVILFDGKNYVYIDGDDKVFPVTVMEKRAFADNPNLYLVGNTIYKKDGDSFTRVGIYRENRLYTIDGENYLAYNPDTKELEEKPVFVEMMSDALLQYQNKFKVTKGVAFNKDGIAHPEIVEVTGKSIVLKDDAEKYFAGRIVTDEKRFVIDNEKRLHDAEDYKTKTDAVVDESGKLTDIDATGLEHKKINNKDYVVFNNKTYAFYKKAVFDKENMALIPGYTFEDNSSEHALVVDRYGRLKDYFASFKDGVWTFTQQNKDGSTNTRSTLEDNVLVEDSTIIVGGQDKLMTGDEAKKLERVEGDYYYNGTIFTKADSSSVIGEYFYTQLFKILLESKEKTVTYQKDGNTVNIDDKKIIEGSTDKNLYFEYDGKLYVKDKDRNVYKQINGNDVLTDKDLAVILQKTDQGDKLAGEGKLYDFLNKAKIGLKLPGFHVGPEFIYTLITTASLKYLDPSTGEIKDVFSSVEGKKEVVKKFTLKPMPEKPADFGKNAPRELTSGKPMDYQVFNLLFRGTDDRERDSIFTRLFTEADLTDKEKALKDLIEKEYKIIYKKDIKFVDGKIVAVDEKGKESSVERSLAWEIYISSEDKDGYPAGNDEQIIIDDTNLDNRLVYETVIFRDTDENYQLAKQTAEKAGEKFQSLDSLTSIDELASIDLGVNPYYTHQAFVPVRGLKIKGEDVLASLGDKEEASITLNVGGEIRPVKIIRDRQKGTISISVKDAFLMSDGISQVQKAYDQEKALYAEEITNAASIDDIKKIIDTHYKDSPCEKELRAIVDEQSKIIEESPEHFSKLKNAMISVLERMDINYIEETKKYKNSSFNALRIRLKEGVKIGGALNPSNTRKTVNITSVIKSGVDLPYTDEYGEKLTNFEMYYTRYIREALLSDEYKDIVKGRLNENSDPQKFLSFAKENLSEKAYRQLLMNAHKKATAENIKTLVKGDKLVDAMGMMIYHPVEGRDLAINDLTDAKGNPLKDKNTGALINGYYTGGKGMEELGIVSEELVHQSINLIGYYLNPLGYDRATFANSANHKIISPNPAPTLFGDKDAWKKKICPDGILGSCLLNSGMIASDGEDVDKIPDSYLEKSGSNVTISYEPPTTTPDEEKPKVDKTSDKSVIDFNDDEAAKNISFNVALTVDHKSLNSYITDLAIKTGKSMEEIMNENAELLSNYNENGYMVIKNGLLIDLLPEVLDTKDMKVTVKLDDKALLAGGANKNLDLDAFKAGLKPIYVSDLNSYIDSIKTKDKDKYEILEKMLSSLKSRGEAIGEKQGAVLLWLPEFEAPHGSNNQVVMTLDNLTVHKDSRYGMWENKSIYTSIPWEGYSYKKFRVQKKNEGNVNKYLRVFDAEGNPLVTDDEWFQGTANLTLGDKFDYKITFKADATTDTSSMGGYESLISELVFEDILPNLDEYGIRPVLREKIKVPQNFQVTYYDKEGRILEGDFDLSQVYKVKMELKNGKGINPADGAELILPMEIPEISGKLVDGKLVLENGNVLDLEKIKAGNNEAINTAQVNGQPSNPVKIKLKDVMNLQIIKIWEDINGKSLSEESLAKVPDSIFNIYQIDENGLEKLYAQVTVGKENEFSIKLKELPIKHEIIVYNNDGTVNEKESVIHKFTYRIEEVNGDKYGAIIVDEITSNVLGAIYLVKNIAPEIPVEPGIPDNPNPNEPGIPDNPNPNEPGIPDNPNPNEPGIPDNPNPNEPGIPDNPNPNEPGIPDNPNPNEPGTPDKPKNENPKTGDDNSIGLYLVSMLLAVGCLATANRRKKSR